jgi:hypothetical protein
MKLMFPVSLTTPGPHAKLYYIGRIYILTFFSWISFQRFIAALDFQWQGGHKVGIQTGMRAISPGGEREVMPC